MAVVYRDKRGVEYESVPLPTNEVTDAVPLNAHIVSKRVVRKPVPSYEGIDGEQLESVPRSQRRNWTERGPSVSPKRRPTTDSRVAWTPLVSPSIKGCQAFLVSPGPLTPTLTPILS